MLYLHIGTGKAGSTTIQDFLGSDTELPFGYRQIAAWGTGNAWKIAAASGSHRSRDYWVDERGELTEADLADVAATLWQAVSDEAAGAPPGTRFVASSEYIIGQYAGDRVAIERLHGHLTGIFGEVRLLVYLRDQVRFLKSLYAQHIRGPRRGTQSFSDFMDDMESFRPIWDYWGTLSLWAEVFGAEALSVVHFEPGNFIGGSLVTDFLDRIDVGGASARAKDARRSNTSPSYAQLSLLRRVNHLRGTAVYRPMRRAILSPVLRFKSLDYPARYDAEILARVGAGNQRLNDSYLRGQKSLLPV